MSFDSELHEHFGMSQGDPEAIDKIVDILHAQGKPAPKARPVTFGEVAELLRDLPNESRTDPERVY